MGVSVFATENDVQLQSFDAWQIRSTWPELENAIPKVPLEAGADN
ncbi:MAG: hypothetical protein WD294_15115 [Phycisphaeraceae bacterium]